MLTLASATSDPEINLAAVFPFLLFFVQEKNLSSRESERRLPTLSRASLAQQTTPTPEPR